MCDRIIMPSGLEIESIDKDELCLCGNSQKEILTWIIDHIPDLYIGDGLDIAHTPFGWEVSIKHQGEDKLVNVIGFVRILEKMDCGIVALNTYMLNGKNHFYIMIAERGNTGIFLKKEGATAHMHNIFEDMLGEIDDLIVEHEKGKLKNSPQSSAQIERRGIYATGARKMKLKISITADVNNKQDDDIKLLKRDIIREVDIMMSKNHNILTYVENLKHKTVILDE